MLKRSAAPRLRTDRTAGSFMESLENRVMFGVGSTPFPTIDMLEDPNNTVVRFQTSRGDIDIELFDSVAPGTVDNFLRYVREGHYDQSFFHRLAFLGDGVTPFVLQGGGFRFDNATAEPFHAVPTYDTIPNEFMRSNTERTLAMAKLGGNPDSATSQFFINLGDNSANLDNQNGGFTVFARILGDASWNVVLDIQGLTRSDMQSAPEFSDFFNNFATVPTTGPYTPFSNVTEDLLVRINDAEIIKPRNVQAFYTVQVYYPEGFAGSTISEFLPMGNPGDTTVHYQVIVRSEVTHGDISQTSGWFRDRVIDTGSIAPHSRGGITISQFGPDGAPGENDKVPQGVPYAIEVWATGEVAANLSHYDFGTSTGEAFTPITSTSWSFGEGVKRNGDVFDFLVWDNPNDVDANLTITFYFDNMSSVQLQVTTDAYRRGGLAFANVAQIPDNTVFSARIVSNVPIVAALSHFDRRDSQTGSSALGTPGDPSLEAVIPFSQGPDAVDSMKVSFFNPGNTVSVISIRLRFENPAEEDTVATVIVPQGLRRVLDIGTINRPRIANGETFSLHYRITVGAAVFGHAQIIALEDAVSQPVSITTATTWLFAEGFMDPARAGDSVLETLTVYNPNSSEFGVTNRTANVTFSFFYGDGFTLTHTVQLGAGARTDLYLDEFQPILDQGTQNGRFFFSVRISADVSIIAQMIHYDTNLGGLQASGGFSTLGTPSGTITRLDQLT